MKDNKYMLITRARSRSRILLSALLTASIVLSLLTSPILASADVSTGGAPAQPAAAGSYSVSTADSASYVEPVNTFSDGSPMYYLVTQDPLKASWTSVTYDGIDYPLSPATIKVLPSVGGIAHISSITGIFTDNATIFFDAGTYNDTDPNAYTRFSNTNLSMVGLYKDAAGEPTAKITKSVRTDGMIERNIVMHRNIYYENLIFDGQGKNLVTKSRGETVFAITGVAAPNDGSAGFVMNDCIIQNYGATNSLFGTNKNVAIMFYQTTGQHNIDNLKIRSIKTQGAYGIISFNQAAGNYLRDISIDGSLASGAVTAIKIESAAPNIFAANLIANSFTGSLTLAPSGNISRIYIQDYGYSTVLPDTLRYVQYSTSNGYTGTFSKQAAYVSSVLPPVTSQTAVWDRNDNYWIVRSGAAQTVSAQLDCIKSVLTNAAADGGAVPTANIKLSANAAGVLDSYTVPDFGDIDVNIVALAATSDPYSSTAMIPLASGAVITLPGTNYSKVKLYNIDFHQYAKYTLQETVSGINPATVSLTDPNESGSIAGYPVYSTYAPTASPAKVTRSSSDTFVNCRFTSLAGEIEVANIIHKIGTGGTAVFTAQLRDSETNSYTGSGITSGLRNTADDITVNWFSSDPSVVSIDKLTGAASALSAGTVTITAKAADSHNNGEIEKPFVTFSLQAVLPYTVTYSGNGNTGGSLSSAVNSYLDGDTPFVFGIETLVRDGYNFTGWNTMEDGSGTLYQPGDVLAVSNNMVFFAQWELIPLTSTPTPSVTPDPTVSPAPSVTPDPSVTPSPTVTPEVTAAPEPSMTPEPSATPAPTVTPEPSVTPAAPPVTTAVPTAVPTAAPTPTAPTAAPTPPTGVLGTDRVPENTPAATPTPAAATPAPTAAPAGHVLAAVVKTGEKTDPILIPAAVSLILSGCVLSWVVMRKRKKSNF